jgi:hypothetical protein
MKFNRPGNCDEKVASSLPFFFKVWTKNPPFPLLGIPQFTGKAQSSGWEFRETGHTALGLPACEKCPHFFYHQRSYLEGGFNKVNKCNHSKYLTCYSLIRSNEFERKTREYHAVADQCEVDIRQVDVMNSLPIVQEGKMKSFLAEKSSKSCCFRNSHFPGPVSAQILLEQKFYREDNTVTVIIKETGVRH